MPCSEQDHQALVDRVTNLENTLARIELSLARIEAALVGDITGGRGLFSRISNLEDAEDTRRKFTLTAVCAAIASAVTAVFSFFR